MPKNDPAAALLAALEPSWAATQHQLEQIRKQLASTNGIMRRGAEYRPVTVSRSVSTSPGQLAGFSLRNTDAANSATVNLYDDVAAGDTPLMTVELAPGESTREWFMPYGIGFTAGLFFEVAAGAVVGSIYLGPAGA